MKGLVPSLVVLCLLLFFYGLGSRDFWAPDEGDFAEIVSELDYNLVVPHLNGAVYAEKPPLFYYIAYLSKRLFSGLRDEVRLRLPSAFFALIFMLAFAATVRAHFSRRLAWTASLMLLTSPLFYWQARYLQVDMVFSSLVACSLFAFLWFQARGSAIYGLAFFVCLGLAFLTKGPLAVVLVAPPIIAFLIVQRDASVLRRPALYVGCLLFIAIVIPWYLAVQSREGWEFLYENVIRQNVLRFTEAWSHRRPFYYYFTTLPLDFFPWSLFLPAGFVVAFRNWKREAPLLYLLLFFLWTFLFLSLSSGKISKYMLPALPSLAVTAAVGIETGNRRYGKAAFAVLALLFLLTGAVLIAFRTGLYPELYQVRLLNGLAAALFGAGLLYASLRGQLIRAFTLTSMLLVLLYSVANASVYDKWNVYKSPRPFSEKVRSYVGDGTPWVYYGSMRGVYVYYVGSYAISIDEHDQRGLKNLTSNMGKFYIVTRQRDVNEVREALVSVETVETATIGGTDMVLLLFKAVS